MADRVFGFHVLLDKEYREDDIQTIIDAVKMIRGVKTVDVHISTADTWMAYAHARMDIAEKLFEIYKEFADAP